MPRFLQNGLRAPVAGVAIHAGIKGEGKAVLRFRTETGGIAGDAGPVPEVPRPPPGGDGVVALSGPLDPGNAAVDTGAWMWQAPGLRFAGFMVPAGLAIPVWRLQARQDKAWRGTAG